MAQPIRASSPQSYRLGARSCRACHQRKVRCDRGVPCTNCSKCGISCVYPTKLTDPARKSPSLQTISNRLERLEVLLSRLTEDPQRSVGPTAAYGGSGRRPQASQIQVEPSANASLIGTSNQHPSEKRPCKLTWELLLNDEQVVRYEDNSNIDSLTQDVSLGFASSLRSTLLSTETLCTTRPS